LLAGRQAGRVKDRSLLASGLVMSSAGGILLLASGMFHWGLYIIIPGLFLVVSSVGIIATTTSSLALQNQGQSAGTASALLGMLSFVIGGGVAPLVGIGGTQTIMPLAIVMGVLVFAAVLCFKFSARQGDPLKKMKL
jgi:DHA1 family bicyclomycin/chloramphenicol resistance-like MFS transporter